MIQNDSSQVHNILNMFSGGGNEDDGFRFQTDEDSLPIIDPETLARLR
jgi:hypothetical protein